MDPGRRHRAAALVAGAGVAACCARSAAAFVAQAPGDAPRMVTSSVAGASAGAGRLAAAAPPLAKTAASNPGAAAAVTAGAFASGLVASIRHGRAATRRRAEEKPADKPGSFSAMVSESESKDGAAAGVPNKQARADLEKSGEYKSMSEGQRNAVSNFFFPDEEELDMDKSMPLEDHVEEFRQGAIRAGVFTIACISVCLYFYKELTTIMEGPAQVNGMVKFVQLAPGEFFFVSLKAAVAVGLLLAFPYILFEAAVYFTPALTRSERGVVGPTVASSAFLFYAGVLFAFYVLDPAALGFFVSYSAEVIESQFSIDQYFEFILSTGFAVGLAFQVPVLQVALGMFNVVSSEQLFSIWRYVIVGSAIAGAVLTPSTDPVTQLLLTGALCTLYFAGAGTLRVMGR